MGHVCGFCVAAPPGRARLLLPGAVETAEGAAADADMANDDEEAGAGEAAAAAAAVAVEAAEKRAAGAGDLLAMLGE